MKPSSSSIAAIWEEGWVELISLVQDSTLLTSAAPYLLMTMNQAKRPSFDRGAGLMVFSYREIDALPFLPANWDQQILEVVDRHASHRTLISSSITSREGRPDVKIPVITVGGKKVRKLLPWLYDLYRNEFLQMGQECVTERLVTAKDDRYGVNVNVQRGPSMRYEAHIDSNPLEGLLYVTSHNKGSGGELVVSNKPYANSVDEIEEDCVKIYPKRGKLLFFDARDNPHYVAPLKDTSVRAVVAMNFYTLSWPEEYRPKDLNRHLFGED